MKWKCPWIQITHLTFHCVIESVCIHQKKRKKIRMYEIFEYNANSNEKRQPKMSIFIKMMNRIAMCVFESVEWWWCWWWTSNMNDMNMNNKKKYNKSNKRQNGATMLNANLSCGIWCVCSGFFSRYLSSIARAYSHKFSVCVCFNKKQCQFEYGQSNVNLRNSMSHCHIAQKTHILFMCIYEVISRPD